MAKGLEKKYNTLPDKEFQALLDGLKNNPDTMHFFQNTDHPYFFLADSETNQCILNLHHDVWTFDQVYQSFSDFAKKQILQSFLIHELMSTNLIENIQSTRHDIFHILNQIPVPSDRKLISVVNGYQILLNGKYNNIGALHDLRAAYDAFMKDAIAKKDMPDGILFRKDAVSVTDGMKNVHQGFYPEDNIISAMTEFLNLYNDTREDVFIRNILAHFLIETIHPFYDGNGRFGRFLFTRDMLKSTQSYLAFTISAAINSHKSKYYRMLNEGRSIHAFGSLNQFFIDFSTILHNENKNVIQQLEEQQKLILNQTFDPQIYTKSERILLRLIFEATLFSEYGITNQEMIAYGNLSKRTVITAVQKFRDNNLLTDTKIGRITYHKLNKKTYNV